MEKISILLGSIRQGRQGIKVANYLARELQQRGKRVNLIDPLQFPGLLIFQERFRYLKDPNEDLVKVQQMLDESDGFVAVSPEYNYSYSPVLKQTIDYFFNEFKFKPMALVGYSGGPFGGARAIENMKTLSVALGMTPVPSFWSIPFVQNQFDDSGNLKEELHKKNMEKMLREFDWYLTALKNQRKLDPSIVPKAVKEV